MLSQRSDLLIADLLNVVPQHSGGSASDWPETLKKFEQQRYCALLILARSQDPDLLSSLQWMQDRSPKTVFGLILNDTNTHIESSAQSLGVTVLPSLMNLNLAQDLVSLKSQLVQKFYDWREQGFKRLSKNLDVFCVGQGVESVVVGADTLFVPGSVPMSVDFDLYWEFLLERLESAVVILSPEARTTLLRDADRVAPATFIKNLTQILQKTPNALLTSRDLTENILNTEGVENPGSYKGLPYNEAKRLALEAFHKNYIDDLLCESAGNITVAAERAELDRSNFKKIIRKYRKDL